MCGPRDVAVNSPTVTTATGESSGQDRSSAAGIFVLTVEHVQEGGGVLLFVIVVLCTLVWLVDVLGEYCLLPHLGLSPTGLIRIAKMKAKKGAKPRPTSTEYLPDILKPGYLATIELTPVDRAV